MNTNLTTEQLQLLTDEANEFMETSGKQRFPTAKNEELATYGAKRCNRCKEVMLIEDFGKDTTARDGLSRKCKPCISARDADYYQRNTDKALEYQRDYYQRNRGRISEYQREHYAANRDQRSEYNREYHRTKWATDEIYRLNKQLDSGFRRAVAAGVQADWITAEQLLTYWEAKHIPALECYLTGSTLTPFDRSPDHVVAISSGGGHVVENLMPATLEANLRKNNLTPEDAKEKLSND